MDHYHHQTFSDSDLSMSSLSDLAIAGLFQNMSTVQMKPPHARVAHACDHCRRLKTKCSGQQPECASCLKRGRVCQWTPLKTAKYRRSRKPYDAWIQYQPPLAPAPKAPEPSHVETPRSTYSSPSVMLPWSAELEGTKIMSFAQADSLPSAPMVETMVQQAYTDWNAPQYGCEEDWNAYSQWIPSPPSSCPSSSSTSDDCSSWESSSSTYSQSTTQETPSFAGASFSPVQAPLSPSESEIETFFHQLYQCISPDWTSFDSIEFEKFFSP